MHPRGQRTNNNNEKKKGGGGVIKGMKKKEELVTGADQPVDKASSNRRGRAIPLSVMPLQHKVCRRRQVLQLHVVLFACGDRQGDGRCHGGGDGGARVGRHGLRGGIQC